MTIFMNQLFLLCLVRRCVLWRWIFFLFVIKWADYACIFYVCRKKREAMLDLEKNQNLPHLTCPVFTRPRIQNWYLRSYVFPNFYCVHMIWKLLQSIRTWFYSSIKIIMKLYLVDLYNIIMKLYHHIIHVVFQIPQFSFSFSFSWITKASWKQCDRQFQISLPRFADLKHAQREPRYNMLCFTSNYNSPTSS